MCAEPGVLREHRLTTGKIARTTITNQAAIRLHVHAFSDHELCPRISDVISIRDRFCRGGVWIDKAPIIFSQQSKILDLSRVDVECDLKLLAGQARQRHELTELMDAQAIGLAAILDRAGRVWRQDL